MSTFFNPYWLEPGAAVPVDIATTAALVTEIQRLRQALAQPEQEPVAWVGLTDEEREYLWGITRIDDEDRFAFVLAVEARLKEKNT